jgi:Universal stress protein family
VIEGSSSSVNHRWSNRESSSFSSPVDSPQVVLVAVNGSPTAASALSYLSGLARRNDSTLVLLHVHEPTPFALWGEAMGAPAIGTLSDDSGAELVGTNVEICSRAVQPESRLRTSRWHRGKRDRYGRRGGSSRHRDGRCLQHAVSYSRTLSAAPVGQARLLSRHGCRIRRLTNWKPHSR